MPKYKSPNKKNFTPEVQKKIYKEVLENCVDHLANVIINAHKNNGFNKINNDFGNHLLYMVGCRLIKVFMPADMIKINEEILKLMAAKESMEQTKH